MYEHNPSGSMPNLAMEADQARQIINLLAYVDISRTGTWDQLNRSLARHYDETVRLLEDYEAQGYPIVGFDILSSGILLGAINDVNLQAEILGGLEEEDYFTPDAVNTLTNFANVVHAEAGSGKWQDKGELNGYLALAINMKEQEIALLSDPLAKQAEETALFGIMAIALGATGDSDFRRKIFNKIKYNYVLRPTPQVNLFEGIERKNS